MSIFGEYTKKKRSNLGRVLDSKGLYFHLLALSWMVRDKPANRAVNKRQAKSKARILRAQGTGLHVMAKS